MATSKIREIAEKAYLDTVGEDENEPKGVRTAEVEAEREQEAEPEVEEQVEEQPEEQPETEEETPEEPEVEEETEETEPEPDYSEITHPQVLNEEERNLFDGLPNKKSKKLVSDLVTRLKLSHQNTLNHSIHKLNQEYMKQVEPYKDLDKVVKSYEHYFKDGTTPTERLENSLAWDDYLEESPHAAISELMEQYGVTPHDYFNGQAQQALQSTQNGNQQDSEVVAKLNKIEQELLQEKKQKEISQIDSDLDTFIGATDKQGQKLFPLVEYLEVYMAPVIKQLRQMYPQASRLELLPHAYNQALTMAPPEVQELIQKARTQKKETKKPGKQGSSLKPKNNGKPVAKPGGKKDIRSIVEEAWEQTNAS